MSDSEKLDLILTGVFDLNTRMYRVEEEIRLFKDRMDKVEAELKEVKEEIALLKDGMKEVKEEINYFSILLPLNLIGIYKEKSHLLL